MEPLSSAEAKRFVVFLEQRGLNRSQLAKAVFPKMRSHSAVSVTSGAINNWIAGRFSLSDGLREIIELHLKASLSNIIGRKSKASLPVKEAKKAPPKSASPKKQDKKKQILSEIVRLKEQLSALERLVKEIEG
jgi:hypothetical protein